MNMSKNITVLPARKHARQNADEEKPKLRVAAYCRVSTDSDEQARGMALSIFVVIFAIGIILAVFPPEQIAQIIGKQNALVATIAAAAFGTITLIPAFIAFPLIGTLAGAGLGIMPSVAFLTTLTMVGVATFPLEKKEFGVKFAITRNVLSFVFAIIIALIMGVIL